MGGVAGHMAHVSEDLSLTFDEVVEILNKVANAEIEEASEKVDGQNLFLTVDANGNVRTARNSGDIKKGGMTTEEYVSKWKNHPAEAAFTNGFLAVQEALFDLDPEDMMTIFGGGRRWINMEIMYPKNPNIILYTAPQVVLHSLQDFSAHNDPRPSDASETEEQFRHLSHAVDSIEVYIANEKWTVNGPKIVKLQKLTDGTILDTAVNKIEKFAAPVGMWATLEDIVKVYYKKLAFRRGLPKSKVRDIITLVFDPEIASQQELTLRDIKKGLSPEQKGVVSELATKTNSRKVISKILLPLEKIISDFAIEVLRGMKSFFVQDNDKEVSRMRLELEKSIAHLRNLADSGNPDMGELVDKHLAKLGDIENVASSMEGFVFEYPPASGRTYKMTGAFAMSNQIIGRARRSGMDEEIENEDDDPVIDASYPKTVAIVPGAFKPPHKGHADMVRRYATGDGVPKADKVYVVISAPMEAQRSLRDGTVIDANNAIALWQKLFPEVTGLPGVELVVAPSDMRSPITVAYKYISDESPLPLNNGDRVILGASDKPDTKEEPDWRRWDNIDPEKHVKPGITLLSGEEYAVPAFERAGGGGFSATDMRDLISDLVENPRNKEAYRELSEFVPPEKFAALFDELGKKIDIVPSDSEIDEMAAMAGGAVGGYAGPLGSTSDKPAKRDIKKKKQKQYIDLGLLAEVMELIIERGINNETK